MAIDLVCKMEVNKLTAKFKSVYNDRIFKKPDKHQPPMHGVC